MRASTVHTARLKPGASVTVTVSLTASADADGGTVMATLQGRTAGWDLAVVGR